MKSCKDRPHLRTISIVVVRTLANSNKSVEYGGGFESAFLQMLQATVSKLIVVLIFYLLKL